MQEAKASVAPMQCGWAPSNDGHRGDRRDRSVRHTAGLSMAHVLIALIFGLFGAFGCVSEPEGVFFEVHIDLPADGPVTQVTLPIARLSLQPEGRPRSVDWARYPPQDGWWDAGVEPRTITARSGGTGLIALGRVRPADGRWQRVWLDLNDDTAIVVPRRMRSSALTTEDHAEPTAIELRMPEDLGKTMRINLVALPSGTQDGAWILAVKGATLR